MPGQDQAERLRRECWAILQGHVGARRAVTRTVLASELRHNLGLHHWTGSTLQRRLREALSDLVEHDGRRIVSGPEGIYVAETAEEIQAGDKALAGNAFGALRRLAAYRRVTLASLLEGLGQGRLGVGE
jgi:hypothetical protein